MPGVLSHILQVLVYRPAGGAGQHKSRRLRLGGKRLNQLKLAQDFAAVTAVHAAMQHRVDIVAKESHGTIAEQYLSTARMKAARSKEAGEVHNNIRDSAVGRVVAVRQSADGTGMCP